METGLPAGWLWTDRSELAVKKWNIGIDPFFFYCFPNDAPVDLDAFDADSVSRLRVKTLIYNIDGEQYKRDKKIRLAYECSDESDSIKWEFHSCEYTAKVKIDRLEDQIIIDNLLVAEQPNDSLLEAYIGKLSVEATITSIDGVTAQINLPLVSHNLSAATTDKIGVGLFLYTAQCYGGEWRCRGTIDLTEDYIKILSKKYS